MVLLKKSAFVHKLQLSLKYLKRLKDFHFVLEIKVRVRFRQSITVKHITENTSQKCKTRLGVCMCGEDRGKVSARGMWEFPCCCFCSQNTVARCHPVVRNVQHNIIMLILFYIYLFVYLWLVCFFLVIFDIDYILLLNVAGLFHI